MISYMNFFLGYCFVFEFLFLKVKKVKKHDFSSDF